MRIAMPVRVVGGVKFQLVKRTELAWMSMLMIVDLD